MIGLKTILSAAGECSEYPDGGFSKAKANRIKYQSPEGGVSGSVNTFSSKACLGYKVRKTQVGNTPALSTGNLSKGIVRSNWLPPSWYSSTRRDALVHFSRALSRSLLRASSVLRSISVDRLLLAEPDFASSSYTCGSSFSILAVISSISLISLSCSWSIVVIASVA